MTPKITISNNDIAIFLADQYIINLKAEAEELETKIENLEFLTYEMIKELLTFVEARWTATYNKPVQTFIDSYINVLNFNPENPTLEKTWTTKLRISLEQPYTKETNRRRVNTNNILNWMQEQYTHYRYYHSGTHVPIFWHISVYFNNVNLSQLIDCFEDGKTFSFNLKILEEEHIKAKAIEKFQTDNITPLRGELNKINELIKNPEEINRRITVELTRTAISGSEDFRKHMIEISTNLQSSTPLLLTNSTE